MPAQLSRIFSSSEDTPYYDLNELWKSFKTVLANAMQLDPWPLMLKASSTTFVVNPSNE